MPFFLIEAHRAGEHQYEGFVGSIYAVRRRVEEWARAGWDKVVASDCSPTGFIGPRREWMTGHDRIE